MLRTLSALTIAAVVLAAGMIAGSAAAPYSPPSKQEIAKRILGTVGLLDLLRPLDSCRESRERARVPMNRYGGNPFTRAPTLPYAPSVFSGTSPPETLTQGGRFWAGPATRSAMAMRSLPSKMRRPSSGMCQSVGLRAVVDISYVGLFVSQGALATAVSATR